MKDFKLPHAIVISCVLVVFGLLAWQEIDTGVVIGGALAILGALGWVIKQGAENGEQNRAILSATNGTNHSLVDTIKHQHAEAMVAATREREATLALVTQHQEMTAAIMRETNDHFRALAEKLAIMVPVAAVAPAVVTLAPISAPPSNGEALDVAHPRVVGYP